MNTKRSKPDGESREGEAPAEPFARSTVVPPSRLGGSLALPNVAALSARICDLPTVLFGQRFEGLGPLEVQSLVTALQEGSVSNSRMRLESDEHATDLTKMLQGLVAKGFFDQRGQKRGAFYVLAKSADSSHSGGSSLHIDEKTSEQDVPTGSELSTLREIAKPAVENRHLSPDQTRRLIQQLCTGRFLTPAELGELMQRTAEGLRSRFLKPMVDEGLLIRKFPTEVNRQDQAYTAKPV